MCATHGPFNFQNRQASRNFKVDTVKSIPRIHGWWIKISGGAIFKEQLALSVRGERRLKHIVRSRRSQTLAQITTQLNDGGSRAVSKRIVQRWLHHMGFGSRRHKRPLLNSRHRATSLA
ncbi:HTH_Tnp_Tc3_2 domain-containing protein [Trichonephila clavipes]|nr:HTH_Tnp_Tc3_2 domain-containing protein [Trichonephila clavipes]